MTLNTYHMKKDEKNFEVILSESNLLDSEMEALRGGAGDNQTKCGEGVFIHCKIGIEEEKP